MSDSVPYKKISFSQGEEKMDRISILPDPILSHMLSFLPTKTSVATSALSKRWKGVWTTVPSLSFRSSDFMDILVDPDPVYKVLNSIQVPSVQQLSLNLTQVEEGQHQRVNQWISSAINRQLEVMRLNLNTFVEPPVRIPSIVFASNWLVCLTLSNDIVVDIPDNAKLPSLKYLQLERVWYENVGTFSRLLSSCIILEDLTVERSWYDDIGGLDITVPTLKKLNLKVPRTGARLCNLLINTPSLEKIEFGELVNWGSKVNNLSNLMEAVLHIDRTRRVIKELGNVRLSLSEDVSWSIFCDMTLKLPTFSNLIYLEITCCCDHWDGLSAFLKASHNIKTLVFHIRVKSQHMSRSCDKTMKTVPKCISLSLTTVKLTGFYDVECSRELIQYILRNAGNLKHMHIKTALEIKRCHWERLLRCPKASAECAISFLDSSGKEIKM